MRIIYMQNEINTYYWVAGDEYMDLETVEAKTLDDAIEQVKDHIQIHWDRFDDSKSEFWGIEIYETDDEARDDPVHRETWVQDPIEPECDNQDGHTWIATSAIEGGLEENPGVFGHGGGVRIYDHCKHCGQSRVQDTWAQNPATGEEGFHTVEYPDEKVDISHTDED